ncbi:MAG: hypothetical protein K2O85_02515 [Helicobacter sp.]|nr:hypothetical protein [Helicobacter sp.]
MFITTNTNTYSPTIVKHQAPKTRETQEFASQLSTEEPKILDTSAIQKQTQEFPKGLLQDIENLSNLMLDIDTYTKVGKARGEIYSNGNGNTSFVLGGYEYIVSKADESVALSDMKNSWSYGTAWNAITKDHIHNRAWIDIGSNNIDVLWIDDNFDKTRYRPFSPHQIYDEATGKSFSVEIEAFPEVLNRQPDMGYTYADFESNLRTIEKLVDKQLLAEYEKDPRSDETQQILFLKAKINTISEVVEKDREAAIEQIPTATFPLELIFENRDLWANQTAMLAEFSLNLNKFLSDDEQQQVIDSLNVILNYSDHHWFEGFGAEISSLFKQDIAAAQLKESSKEFQESLISRFSAIDNTEILLNLASDSNLQTNTKESKSYESLIDRIRSKLKGNDDSILQQVMSKITNGVKTNGIGEGT